VRILVEIVVFEGGGPQQSCAVISGRQCYRHSQPQPSYTTSVRQQPPLRLPASRSLGRRLGTLTLPSSVQEQSDTESFKRHLKTVVFQRRYWQITAAVPRFN